MKKPLSTLIIASLIITAPGPFATRAFSKVLGKTAATANGTIAIGKIGLPTLGSHLATPGQTISPSLTGSLPTLNDAVIFETATPVSKALIASPRLTVSPKTITPATARVRTTKTETKAPVRETLTANVASITEAKSPAAQRVSLNTLFTGRGFRDTEDAVVAGRTMQGRSGLTPAVLNGADTKHKKVVPPKAPPVAIKDRLLSPFRAIAKAGRTIKDSISWILQFKRTLGKQGINVKWHLISASALSIVSAFAYMVPPVLLGKMMRNMGPLEEAAAAFKTGGGAWYEAFSNPVIQDFMINGGIIIGAYAVVGVLSLISTRILYDVGNRLMKGINDMFMKHVLRLPMSWHDRKNSGDVIATGTEAIYAIQRASTDIVVNTVKHGAFFVLTLGAMFYLNWQMTIGIAPFLAFFLAVPAVIYSNKNSLVYRWFFSKLKPKLTGHITQATANIATVKAAGHETEELAKIEEWSQKTYMEGGGAIAKIGAPYRAMKAWMNDAAKILVILAAVVFIYNSVGGIGVAAATTYFLLANIFRESVEGIYSTYVQLRQMQGSARKYDTIMGEKQEDYNENGVVLPESQNGRAIRFEGVSFGYEEQQTVIDDVTLDIKAGESVAFVGSSGSGKTTMTRLLLGMYKLPKGRVTIDGEDLSSLNKTEFRRKVGTILQDPVPFAASVGFNIAYLRPEATEAEIWQAAEEAGIHDEIVEFGYDHALNAIEGEDALNAAIIQVESRILDARKHLAKAGVINPSDAPIDYKLNILDNITGDQKVPYETVVKAARSVDLHDWVTRVGYATPVGERGVKLSGGQKQRLLIARLFVGADKPWDILVMDEPTAALDGLTQTRIQDAVEKRRGKTTTIMIAHRLSTIQNSDKIVVFHKGRIVEQGTHDELMARGKAYFKLWESQRLRAEVEDQD